MKILHISMIPIWVMGNRSGMPSVSKMIEYLKTKDTEQIFVYLSSKCPEYKSYSEKGLTIIFIPIPKLLSHGNNIIRYIIRNKLLILYILMFRRDVIRKIAIKFRPDIIISHLQISGIISKVLLPQVRYQFLRLYGTQRAYEYVKHYWFKYTNWENVFPFVLNMTGYILTNDGTNSKKLGMLFRIPETEIQFEMNGVDNKKDINEPIQAKLKLSLNIPENAVIGLHVNRLSAFKNIDSLVYFINKAPKEIHWILIGDGPERKELNNIDDDRCVHWLGAIDNYMLGKYYQISDFLVNFYSLSTLTNPNYEALRYNLPIFALKRGYGCDNINSIIVTADTKEELSRIFNREYYEDIKNKSAKLKNWKIEIQQWEEKYLSTWEERYEKDWKFIKRRIQICGKK